MKTIFIILFLPLILYAQQEIIDNKYNFSITIPSGWKTEQNSEMIPLIAGDDKRTNLNMTVISNELNRGYIITDSLVMIFKYEIDKTFSSKKGYKVLSYGLTELGGVNSFYISYNSISFDDINRWTLQYIFFNENSPFCTYIRVY
jgi:hypothetical protein